MPKIRTSKLKLDYPLYACDFDPNNASRLLVAGGGGAGKDGVKNKITALQAFDKLSEVDTLDIGKDNDNVTSLAVGGTVGNATFVYAGVNSGPAELEKGKNEHFRIYVLGKVAGSRAGIQEASRAPLFTSTDKSTYQRILRLSRPHADGAQLGAAATGFGAPHELVIFDSIVADSKSGGRRGALQLDKEPEDVDIIEIGKNNYLVAYCDNHEVYVKQIGGPGDAEGATSIFTIPGAEANKRATGVPTFRALRFLTREFIAVVANRPGRSGAFIQILRIVPSKDGQGISARVAQTLALHKKIPQATGLAVANLNPPVNAGDKQKDTQFILAVPDQNSVSLISMDYQVIGGASIVTQPRRLTRVKDLHPAQITGVSLQFFSPALAAQRATQVLRLATVSVEGTAVMQSLPLFKDPKKEDSHYRIALMPENNSGVTPSGFMTIIAMLLVVLISQTILELAERVPPYLGAKERFPSVVVDFLSATPREAGDVYGWERQHQASSGEAPTKFMEFAEHPIASILDSLRASSEDGQQIVIRPSTPEALDGDVIDKNEHLATINKDDTEGAKEAVERDIRAKIELYNAQTHGKVEGKTWEELGKEQKEAWIERLKEIGHWAGELPQTIFKGVIFSEIAGAVGRGVAGQ